MSHKEKLEEAKRLYETANADQKYVLESLFPELAESEDKRIRKDLIIYLRSILSNKKYGDKFIESWIAWLEKQGEQKPADKIEPKFKVGNKIKLTKEPKYPAREIIAIKNDAYYFDEVVYLPFSRQDEWELVEQNPAWGEGDENIIDFILSQLRSDNFCGVLSKSLLKEVESWFKSLKDRVQPQNQWKPSEGQLECLGYAIEKTEKDWSPLTNNRIYLTLKALKEQLKKLKGE